MKIALAIQFILTMLMLASAYIVVYNEAKFTDKTKKNGVLLMLGASGFNVAVICSGYLLFLR